MLPQLILPSFVNYLQLLSTINVQQVVFIRNETSIDESVIAQLSSRIPTWQVSLSNKTMPLKQSSALFVWMKDPLSSVECEKQKLRQLKQKSIDTFRSKYLILQTTGNGSEVTLRLAWEARLLDFTIIDPQEIHYYNPFTMEYTHVIYNSSTELFPDKVKNFHNYELKVGILNYIPYSYVKNQSGSYNYAFYYGELLQSLRKTANFKIKPDIVGMADYGILKKDGTATGLIGKVMKGELDLVAFGAFLFYSPFGASADRTTYIDIDIGCPIVPLIKLNHPHLLLSASTIASIVTIVVIVVVVYLFSLLLQLDKRLWHPLNTIFLVLGVTVHNIPKSLRDRFVYGTIMIVSLFYSSSMFAQLTSFSVDTSGFEPFDSWKAIDDSGLIPMLHPNVYNITFEYTNDKYLKSLGEKSIKTAEAADICPTWLMQKQNVSCVFEKLLSAVQVETNKNFMKIGGPCFWTVTRSFILPRASPYTHRFNQIIRMIEQSGLQYPWTFRSYYASKKMQNGTTVGEADDDAKLDSTEVAQMLKDNTIMSTRSFLVIGYMVATSVFIAELVLFRIRKWKAQMKVLNYADKKF